MKKSGGKNKMQAVYEENVDENAVENKKALIRLAQESLSFEEVLVLTHNKDEIIRSKALARLCPCRVGEENEQFWARIFEMVDDTSPVIRYQVLHNMCDGSPDSVEERMAEALEKFNRDPDQKIKRQAHKVLASYLKTGKWNVL